MNNHISKYHQIEHPNSLSSRKENYLAYAFFVVLVLFLFGKVFLGYYPMSDKDVTYHYVNRVASAKNLSHGIFPLWDKNVLSGTPSFNNEVLHNPLNLFSFAMVPLAPFLGYFNSYVLLLFICHFLMGFFTFRLCRRTLGLAFLPSLLAGTIYATNMGMKERVDIMSGAFVVLPLVLESVYKFSEKKFFRNAIFNGCLLAIAFYSSSLVGIAWVLIPFGLLLTYRFLSEKKFEWRQAKSFLLFFFFSVFSFFLLSAAVLIPFLISFFSNELVYIGAKGRLILDNSFLNISKLIYFFKKYILQQILPISEFTGSTLVRYKLPLFYKLGTGFWNSYSILFLPSVIFVIANYKKINRKYRILLNTFFTIILIDLLLCITPLYNLVMVLVMKRGIFTKMDFILNLFGGLTVAIALDCILKARQQNQSRKWGLRLPRYLCLVLLLFSILAALIYFIYILSPDLIGKGYLSIANAEERVINDFRYNHKYLSNSELTPWLYIYFISKVAALFLLLMLFKNVKLKLATVLVVCLIFLVSAERVATLNLFASFNAYAKNTVSEDLPLTRFFRAHIRPHDRIVTTNVKDAKAMIAIFKREYGYPDKWEGGLVEYVSLLKPRIKDFFIDGNPFRWRANSYWDINAINGHSMLLPRNALPILQSISGIGAEVRNTRIFEVYTADSKLLDILGTRYVLSSFPIEDPRFKLVFRQVDETICTYVYENEEAFPRSWLVTGVKPVKNKKVVYEMLSEGNIDLRKTVLVSDVISGPFDTNAVSDQSMARIIKYEPNRVEIEVNSKERALLVLSDTYFKGWMAKIDNVPTKIYEVNGFMRGVVVEKGYSVVKFEYLPYDFLFYAGLNTIAIFLVAAILAIPVIKTRFGKI